jgi:hypothetical protein
MPDARERGITAHGRGHLGPAEANYREALAQDPDDLRTRLLLAVVLRQRLQLRAALDELWTVAEGTAWDVPDVRDELGLVLGRLLAPAANARQSSLRAAVESLAAARARTAAAASGNAPLVSVVIPAQADAAALASVQSQSWAHVEIVRVDAAGSLVDAFNAGAARASGRFVAFLEPRHRFAADRLAVLVRDVAGSGARWGYTSASSDGAAASTDAAARRLPDGFAFVARRDNACAGNLFVDREWFLQIGGFRGDAADPAWEFGLRAGAQEEPVVVRQPLYLLDAETGAGDARANPAARLAEDHVAAPACANPLSPLHPENRALLLRELFAAVPGAQLPVSLVCEVAREVRAQAPADATAPPATAAGGRTAIVVLGMHRSGTSALARVLNLCGASLPTRLIAADAERNPRGYWEPVDVVALNERALERLGGSWEHPERVGEADEGTAREFEHDVGLLLASEYGHQHVIVIKDPRMAALAPLWDRALRAAHYRPVYAIPVRHPLEVARSLQARGDMGVRQGLQLWLSYMRRIVAFADAGADAAFVAFEDLLDDWRGVLEQVDDRLDLRLDLAAGAAAADAFVEPAMRRQRADADVLGLFGDDAHLREVDTLYRQLRARCLRPRPRDVRAAPAAATAAFVLCIEDNGIRDQALLLCESIRRYAGRHRRAPVLAFAPRPGLGIDARTRTALDRMDVRYVDEPLNTRCPEYGSANRVFAAAWAERHVDSDFVVVLDSDTIFLDEPELPPDADAAVRPVDSKGSASAGPDDALDGYWRALAGLAGVELDRLPWLRATIGGERIRASYNGGLIVARRDRGLLARWADLFARSVDSGLRPLRGSGQDISASTGPVGRAASEWWGSNQAALALTLWSRDTRVHHYPARYNLPLHLVAAAGAIDPAWTAAPPVHVHYHWMFDPAHRDQALALLAELGVDADRIAWLARRTPLGG